MIPPLVITCDAPPYPPLDGHNLKTFQLLDALRGTCRIHCIAYGQAQPVTQRFEAFWGKNSGFTISVIQPRRGSQFRAWCTGTPAKVQRRDFLAEARHIRAFHSEHSDARVVADFMTGAPIAEHIRSGLVISGHDCMSLLASAEAECTDSLKTRLIMRISAWRTRRIESRYYHRADAVHVVSVKDQQALARITPKAKITVIPLALSAATSGLPLRTDRRQLRLCWFTAHLATQAAGLRLILEAGSPARFIDWIFLGRTPYQEAVQRIPGLIPLKRQYTPFVESIDDLLSTTDIVLLPDIAGAGQKNRTLQAMAHGCCVIGFPEAVRGMPGAHGETYLQVNDARAMASILDSIAGIDTTAIGRRAQEFVQAVYSPQRIRGIWLDMLANTRRISFTADSA